MTAIAFFLGFSGRISRSQWWFGALITLVAIGLMLAIALWSGFPLLAIPLILFVFIATYALTVKRLHDRNRSGWWSLVFIFIPGVMDRWSDRLTEDSALWWVIVLTGSGLAIWGLIELGFRRGTDGDNDYGPDPLAPRERIVESENAAG